MSRRPLASLLGLLALLALGLFWLLHAVNPGGASPSDSASAPVSSAGAMPAAVSSGSTEESAATLQSSPQEPGIEAAATSPVREEVAVAPADTDPKDAIWVEGRMRFPEGTPADEHAEIVATSTERGSDSARGWPVAPDGSFRVALAKKTARVFLDLRARYVYLPAPFELALASRTEASPAIVLSPKLGGCICGRLILATNALDRRPSIVGTSIRASATSDSGRFDLGDRIQRRAKADEALEFELGGMPENRRIRISAHPKDMVDASLEGTRITAGHVVAVELELLLGAHVSGRVVDEKGAPVEGVAIETRIERANSSWSSGTDEDTGADGAFDLTGIRPGKLTLEASKEGWAVAIHEVGEVADGAVKDGLAIVLGRGLAISGRVQWPDGRPASGCRIEYSRSTPPGGNRRFVRNELRSCEAKADGSFEISGLGSEPIALTAQVGLNRVGEEDAFKKLARMIPSQAAATQAAPDLAEAPKKEKAGPHGIAHLEDVKPGTVGLVLTLEVGKSIGGRAIDDTGQPLTLFEVRAEPIDGSDPWDRGQKAIRGAATGKNGSFAIEGLHDGAWDVTAEAKGHAKSAAHRVLLPRDVESFDLVLPRAASISGTVNDPTGAPVERALVRAIPPDDQRGFTFRSGQDEGARTDADGHFTLDGVTPGPEKIVASAEGFADSERLPVEVQPGEIVSGLALLLRRGGRIVGDVLDDAGRPEPSRRVSAQGLSTHDYRTADADASGHFELERLAPGKYVVSSQPGEKEAAALMKKDGQRDLAAWVHLEKHASADVVDGETTKVLLGGARPGGVRVHGTITSAGRPVAGCLLWVSSSKLGAGGFQSDASDAQGHYEMTVEGAGDYNFSLRDQERGTSFIDQIAVPAGESFEHDIAFPFGRIAGRVVGVDGAPAAKISLSLAPEARTAELSASASYARTETDERGAFAFEGLKGGTYRVQAGEDPWQQNAPRKGTCTRTGIVLAQGGSIADLELRLEAAARVEGLVTGPDGQAVVGATVSVRDEQDEVIPHWPPTVTDASGRFSVDWLAPGKAKFSAWTKKLVSAERAPVTLRPGETSRVELTLRPGTVLRVVVQAGDGKVVGASIRVIDDRGREVAGMYPLDFVGNDGAGSTEPGQRVGPVLPGRYKVTATNHDRTSVSQDVSVSGEEQVVTLKLGG